MTLEIYGGLKFKLKRNSNGNVDSTDKNGDGVVDLIQDPNSGGDDSLSWTAPNGLVVGQKLIIETNGDYDFGTGPEYSFFEDFDELSVGSYPTVTNANGVKSESTREDGAPAIRDNGGLEDTAFSGNKALAAEYNPGRNSFGVYVPDAGGPNGKKLFTEYFASYAIRQVGDLRPSDGARYLGNSKPLWIVLGRGFGTQEETASAGNDLIPHSVPGGLDGGGFGGFVGNNSPGGATGSPKNWGWGEWNVESSYVRLINANDRPNHEQIAWGARTFESGYRELFEPPEQSANTILKSTVGATEYDPETTYNTGDTVWYQGFGGATGKNWQSLIDNNTASPEASPGDWSDQGIAYPIGQPAAWDEFQVSGYFASKDGSEIQQAIMDHVLINIGDNAFSRVMLTDSRKYDVATKETVCKPISWTNNKIEVEIRQGLLNAIEGAGVQIALPDLSFLNLRLSGTPINHGNLLYAQSSITTEERSYLVANGDGLILLSFSPEVGSGSASEITNLTVGGQTATRIGREAGGSEQEGCLEVWAVSGLGAGEHEVVATINKNDTEAAMFASFYETTLSNYSSSPIGQYNGSVGGFSTWTVNATTVNDNSRIYVALTGRFNTNGLFGFGAGIVQEVVKNSGGGGQLNGVAHAAGTADVGTAGSYALDFENTGGSNIAQAIAVELF